MRTCGLPGWRSCITLLLSVGGIVLAANADRDNLRSIPLPDRPDGTDPNRALFEQLDADRTGVDFVHRWEPDDEKYEAQLDNAAVAGGVAIGDYDDDGLPDLFLTRPTGGSRLYRNLGDFRFEDVSAPAGIAGNIWSGGASFADVDNDGDLDLYVCGYDHANRLYINRGDGTFEERAREHGLDFTGASVMMAFADYDLDGDLDGYLLTNRLSAPAATKGAVEYRQGRWVMAEEHLELFDVLHRQDGSYLVVGAGQYDHLFRNDLVNPDGAGGQPGFTEVSRQAGITGNYYGLGVAWWDYDHDGLPDLYVSNDFYGPDQLWHNNGDGTFTNTIQLALGRTPWFSMGNDVADVNNDGKLDLLGSDMAATTHYKNKLGMGDMAEFGWFLTLPEPRQAMQNALYMNTGTGRFLEAASLAGLARTDWTWSLKFGDLDEDGREDLFVTNGMTRDWMNSDVRARAMDVGGFQTDEGRRIWLDTPVRAEPNLAYRNRGDLRFDEISQAWGLDHLGVSFGAALGDLDGDGDLDLVVNNFEEPVSVYRNHSVAGHRVKIRLQGSGSNRYGIGARIEARLRGVDGVMVRYLTLARGFMSSNEPVVHFGLGQAQRIESLTIEWPSGQRQEFRDLQADRFYRITEPEGAAPRRDPPEPTAPTQFRRSAALRWIDHVEQPYDDYADQPLLPNKLSQLGPGLAWGDVDGDGADDLYVGGAAGQAGMLYFNDGQGNFDWGPLEPFAGDAAHEDMAPLWFDADGDADLDLYVVSGGVEFGPSAPELRDRLYLNDGRGAFHRAPDGTLPDLRDSGSVVAAADYDRDGDLDLFVGSRVIPGQYPLTPDSRLLRNDAGRFVEVGDEIAPGLRGSGLVTSAIWSDADGDGWVDLLVTHEWGPVKLYRNERGQLVDRTLEAGLAGLVGWWNGIDSRDIDNDGDLDYVVTNFGLNTKYEASAHKPASLYYGDLDGSGRPRIVEGKLEDEILFPVRGKSCSQDAMPFVEQQFPTFHDFASASLEQIYTSQSLDEALLLEATTLESGVLLNDGRARFRFRALPRLAQTSPGFGVSLTDVDADGNTDLYVVQNFFGTQPETPRMDSGVSLLLRGNGDGSFTPVWPDESGLVVTGDATGLAATDLDGDGWIDFAVAINDGSLIAFENRGRPGGRPFGVRLLGSAGNPTGVGARVTLQLDDGTRQTAEVHAGGSYLSQSSSTLVFGRAPGRRVDTIEVHWPDGERTRMTPSAGQPRVALAHPAYSPPPPVRRDLPDTQASPADYARAHVDLAHALRSRGKLEAAVRHYRRALEITPGATRVQHELGLSLVALGDHDAALVLFEQALQARPDDAEIHAARGRALDSSGDALGAIEAYRRVLEIDPRSPVAHHELGLLLEQRGELEDAFTHFAQAVQLRPAYAELHRELAHLLLDQHKLERAIGHCRLVLVVQPDDVVTVHGLANALRSTGAVDAAIEHYRHALRLQPDDATLNYDFGEALEARSDFVGAVSHWERALELEPGFAEASYKLGGELARQGRYQEAAIRYRQCLVGRPDSGNAHYRLGMALVMSGGASEALAHFQEAVRLKPDWPPALRATAWILATHPDADLRDPRTAIRLAERASEVAEHRDPAILDTLAAAYAAAGQFDRAVSTSRVALELAAKGRLADDIGRRLELYRQSKPYTQSVP